jgi:hypothetical protein
VLPVDIDDVAICVIVYCRRRLVIGGENKTGAASFHTLDEQDSILHARGGNRSEMLTIVTRQATVPTPPSIPHSRVVIYGYRHLLVPPDRLVATEPRHAMAPSVHYRSLHRATSRYTKAMTTGLPYSIISSGDCCTERLLSLFFMLGGCCSVRYIKGQAGVAQFGRASAFQPLSVLDALFGLFPLSGILLLSPPGDTARQCAT